MANQPPIESMLPISEAAVRYNLSVSMLHQEISSGKIRAAMFEGKVLVSERDLMDGLPKTQQPEYLKYSHLKGVGIGLRAAGRKYGIPADTISGWVKRELIAIIGHEGKQKLLLDEADVAYCAATYIPNKGRGHRLFNPDGTPYRHKN